MAKSIDSLLKKKGWSGEEVGKALIASTIHDVKHQSEPDYKPLFSQSDFERMESSLSSDRDYTVYGVYRDLYSSIVDAFNRGQGLFQQFYNGYSRFTNYFYLCQQADEALKRSDEYPLIMTQSQYNRYREQAREQSKALRDCFRSLLFNILSYYMEAPEEAPEAIRKAIEATKEEAVTNKRILSIYNETYGQGYYTLPDGRRSDKMTSEEWQKALKELYLKTHSLTINGEPATAEETFKHYSEERLLKTYQLFYKGIEGIKDLYKKATGEEMDGVDAEEEARLLQALEDMLGVAENEEEKRKNNGTAPLYPLQGLLSGLIDGTTASATEWHYYEEAPELTKYELLAECLELYDGTETDGSIEELQSLLDEFIADYPALYKALEAYIKKTVPAFSKMKPANYMDEVISWGELAELDIANYRSLIEPTVYDIARQITGEADASESLKNYSKRRRINRRGIAIAQEPTSWQTDENGDYKEAPDPLSVFYNLDSIAESESQRAELDACQNNLFKPALRFLYAYNALMLIIGAVYDIEGAEALQLSTRTLESRLKSFNNLIYIFYGEVYGDPEEKKRKRELIKELFPPVDTEELKPTKEAIDAVTAELTELGYTSKARKKLKNFDRYIALLMGEGA